MPAVSLSELCRCLDLTELEAKVIVEFLDRHIEVSVHVPEDIDAGTVDVLILAATFRQPTMLPMLNASQKLILLREVCLRAHWPATLIGDTTLVIANPYVTSEVSATWTGSESWLDLNTGRYVERVPARDSILSVRMFNALRQTWSKCPHLARQA